MATGAEHAAEAERLLDRVDAAGCGATYLDAATAQWHANLADLLAASVHACLAIAAALAVAHEPEPTTRPADDRTMLLPTVAPRTGRPQ